MNKAKRIRWIVIYILIGILCVCLLYFALDLPSFSPEMAMHRAESAELVGPSKVIAEDVLEGAAYGRYLLGETEYGYCFYECEDWPYWWDVGSLLYYEKSDVVTVISPWSAMMRENALSESYLCFPVLAIPESTRAVSARLTLTAEYSGVFYEVSKTVSLRQDAYFLFELDVTQTHYHVWDFWYRQLNGTAAVYGPISGTATLELFDSRGELVDTIFLDLTETA